MTSPRRPRTPDLPYWRLGSTVRVRVPAGDSWLADDRARAPELPLGHGPIGQYVRVALGSPRPAWPDLRRGVLSGAAGCTLLGIGMASLRNAYLYRERTGEGLSFLWVALILGIGGLVVLAAVGLLLGTHREGPTRPSAAAFMMSATLLVLLVLCAGVAIWVENRSGCIRSCG